MKSLLELIPYLNGYPLWVRAVLLGLPPLYALVFILLSLFAPIPLLTIETLRRLAVDTKDTLALDVILRNPTAAVANVSGAQLEMYANAKPEGGLSSASNVSATYTIEKSEDDVRVRSDQDKLPQRVAVMRPYANSPYTRMTVPLSQQVKSGEIDRFVIVLRGQDIVLPAHATLELRVDYDGGKTSAPALLAIK